MSTEGPILFYDGVCALCNGAVTFVLKRDATRAVRFAALQGETAKAYLASHPDTPQLVLDPPPGPEALERFVSSSAAYSRTTSTS